jgi:hypothetical protein
MEMTHVDGDDYAHTVVCTVAEAFESMNEGERCHMANKLYKEGYVALKATQAIAEATKAPVVPEVDQSAFAVGDRVRSLGEASGAPFTFGPTEGTVKSLNPLMVTVDAIAGVSAYVNANEGYCYFDSELEHIV